MVLQDVSLLVLEPGASVTRRASRAPLLQLLCRREPWGPHQVLVGTSDRTSAEHLTWGQAGGMWPSHVSPPPLPGHPDTTLTSLAY